MRNLWIRAVIGVAVVVHGFAASSADDYYVSAEVSVLLKSSGPIPLQFLVSPEVSVLVESRVLVSAPVSVLHDAFLFFVSAEVSVRTCPVLSPDDDCNGNGVADECELEEGDLNGNGILDECEPPTAAFVRADANRDGTVDIADVQVIIGYLFLGAQVTCPAALDVDDSDSVALGDAFHALCYLFACTGGLPIEAPFPDCGVDPTVGSLSCTPDPASCP